MAGALRKTMVYLGLAEEDERYDAYDDFEEPDARQETPSRQERSSAVTTLPQRTPVAQVVRDGIELALGLLRDEKSKAGSFLRDRSASSERAREVLRSVLSGETGR